jgi:hypothetical protein
MRKETIKRERWGEVRYAMPSPSMREATSSIAFRPLSHKKEEKDDFNIH